MIVVVNILLDAYLEFVDVGELVQIKELGFKRAEEAFHGSIIQAVCLARHALREPALGQHTAV